MEISPTHDLVDSMSLAMVKESKRTITIGIQNYCRDMKYMFEGAYLTRGKVRQEPGQILINQDLFAAYSTSVFKGVTGILLYKDEKTNETLGIYWDNPLFGQTKCNVGFVSEYKEQKEAYKLLRVPKYSTQPKKAHYKYSANVLVLAYLTSNNAAKIVVEIYPLPGPERAISMTKTILNSVASLSMSIGIKNKMNASLVYVGTFYSSGKECRSPTRLISGGYSGMFATCNKLLTGTSGAIVYELSPVMNTGIRFGIYWSNPFIGCCKVNIGFFYNNEYVEKIYNDLSQGKVGKVFDANSSSNPRLVLVDRTLKASASVMDSKHSKIVVSVGYYDKDTEDVLNFMHSFKVEQKKSAEGSISIFFSKAKEFITGKKSELASKTVSSFVNRALDCLPSVSFLLDKSFMTTPPEHIPPVIVIKNNQLIVEISYHATLAIINDFRISTTSFPKELRYTLVSEMIETYLLKDIQFELSSQRLHDLTLYCASFADKLLNECHAERFKTSLVYTDDNIYRFMWIALHVASDLRFNPDQLIKIIYSVPVVKKPVFYKEIPESWDLGPVVFLYGWTWDSALELVPRIYKELNLLHHGMLKRGVGIRDRYIPPALNKENVMIENTEIAKIDNSVNDAIVRFMYVHLENGKVRPVFIDIAFQGENGDYEGVKLNSSLYGDQRILYDEFIDCVNKQ